MPNERDATHKSLVRLQTVLNKSLGVTTLPSEDACSSKRRTTTSSSSPHFDDDLTNQLLPRRQSSSDPLSTRTFDPAPQFPIRSPAIEQASLILRLFATLAIPNNFNSQNNNPLLLPQQEQALLTLKLFKLLCAKHKQLKKYKSSLRAKRAEGQKSIPGRSSIHKDVQPAMAEVMSAIKESATKESARKDSARSREVSVEFHPRLNPPLRVRRPKTSDLRCSHNLQCVYRIRSSPLKVVECEKASESPPVYRVASVPYGHMTVEESGEEEDYEEENLIAEIRRLRSFIEDLRSEIRPSTEVELVPRVPLTSPLIGRKEVYEQQTQTSPSAAMNGQRRPLTAPLVQGGGFSGFFPPSFPSTSVGRSFQPVQWRNAATDCRSSEPAGVSSLRGVGEVSCPIDPGLMPASLPRVKKSFFNAESRLIEEQELGCQTAASADLGSCAFFSDIPRRANVSSPLSATSLLNSEPPPAPRVQSPDSFQLSTNSYLRKRLQDTQTLEPSTLSRSAPGSSRRHRPHFQSIFTPPRESSDTPPPYYNNYASTTLPRATFAPNDSPAKITYNPAKLTYDHAYTAPAAQDSFGETRETTHGLQESLADYGSSNPEECTFSEQVEKALRLRSSVVEEELDETTCPEQLNHPPNDETQAYDDRRRNTSSVDNFAYANEFASCGSNQSPTAYKSRHNIFESPAEKFRRELQSRSESQYQETLYYDQDYTRSSYAGLRKDFTAPQHHFPPTDEDNLAADYSPVKYSPVKYTPDASDNLGGGINDDDRRLTSCDEQGVKYTSADADYEEPAMSSPNYSSLHFREDFREEEQQQQQAEMPPEYDANRRSKLQPHTPSHWNIGTPERLDEDGETSPSDYASPKPYTDD